MKKIAVLILCFSIYIVGHSQDLQNVDDISPFQEELVAIKKGKQWAFLNSAGEKVIDFRDDLVVSKSEKGGDSYPMFVEGKCLIKKMINGVNHYGYIDTKGSTIIEPQFLNATNFMKGYALIIKLEKTKMGSNSILGKAVTNTKLEEYVIDNTGKTIKYLENSRGYVPSSMKEAPKFHAKFITPKLVATKNLKGKWTIHKI